MENTENGITGIAALINRRHLDAVEVAIQRLESIDTPEFYYKRGSIDREIEYLKRAIETLADYPQELNKYSEILADFIQYKRDAIHREIEEKKIRAYYPKDGMIEHIGRWANFPERHIGLSFFSWAAHTEDQLSAINTVSSWSIRQTEKVNGQSILLYGPPGTGKTHLACAAGAFFGIVYGTENVIYSNAADIVRTIRDSYDSESDHTEKQAFQKFTKPGLLIMDEVGVGKDSDFSRETLHTVISKRYDKKLPTIFITNANAKDFRAAIMERAWDRLQEDGAIQVKMAWDSFRTTPRTGPSRFVCPYPPPAQPQAVETDDLPY